MPTRQVYQEQDATMVLRVPAPIKAWFAMMANETPDRNMSDFARDAFRLYMAECGYDEGGDLLSVITERTEENGPSPTSGSSK